MRQILSATLLLLGVFLVFYFSWIPNPSLSRTGLLPTWIATWTDQDANMNLRTAVPFVLLGLVGSSWILFTKRTWYWWLIVWLMLTGIVGIAELGQLGLPDRHFDWGDIMWGCIGALIGMGIVGLTRFFYLWRA